ncbi:hypothetical protein DPMN_035066 [Dreissena polymorpha]|uniref:Uncharacterized protein n=1 Tax=Dreissena polymorpha TaxID=45954 RepID=A0A9D4M8Z8_DREPO|nr:hypothetical protein DPMN_035066 [Dreissena polymorpha]
MYSHPLEHLPVRIRILKRNPCISGFRGSMSSLQSSTSGFSSLSIGTSQSGQSMRKH